MNPILHQPIIDAFFDTWELDHARHLLHRLIKTADSDKVWKGPCPGNLIHFTDRLQLLIETAFSIVENRDYQKEVVLNGPHCDELWMLTRYETYCGWHSSSTPWDFFPRQLSPEEFKDPYRALRKFTRCRSQAQWSGVIRDLCYYALYPGSIGGFDDGASVLGTWLRLHKLIEATHLIAVRSTDQPHQRRRKWGNGPGSGFP